MLRLTRRTLNFAAICGLLISMPAFAGDERDDTSPGDVPRVKGEILKSALYPLKVRDTLTVALSPLTKNRVPLRAVVRFLDENGKQLAIRKGRVGATGDAFIAKLSHDELSRFDAALVRTEVRLLSTRSVDRDFECPIGVSTFSGTGPAFAQDVGQPCQCGITGGTQVFLNCVGGGLSGSGDISTAQ